MATDIFQRIQVGLDEKRQHVTEFLEAASPAEKDTCLCDDSWPRACWGSGSISPHKGYEPKAEIVAASGDRVALHHDPKQAARDADIIVTDTWASMGQEHEKAERIKAFAGFIVYGALMKLANKDAVFMHCLPAYRGMEVAAEVIDGPQSVVWDEAENRLHAQKALLEFLLSG